ncbi:MAG: hypothetical protein M3P06_07385 [Acidobacteriota bacterium]|nr:hypothetical protein [Acidobacteriota bacterium]
MNLLRSTLCASLFALLIAGCSAQPGVKSVPGQGVVAIEVIPNPIAATPVSGSTYDFPFEVVVRETGGRAIDVQRITATVSFSGGFPLGAESWDAERIRSMGYDTRLAANGEQRYRFTPRKEVPDERLFGGVSAELKVEATDDTGTATSASTVVTVRR